MYRPTGLYLIVINPDLVALSKEEVTDSGIVLTPALKETNERITKKRFTKVVSIGRGVHDNKYDYDPHSEFSPGDYIVLKPVAGYEIFRDNQLKLSLIIVHYEEILAKLEDYEDSDLERLFQEADKLGLVEKL